MALSELPPIDFVVLSHNHYDHLDYMTTQSLPGNPLWFIPKGLDTWFRRQKVARHLALDWWDRTGPPPHHHSPA